MLDNMRWSEVAVTVVFLVLGAHLISNFGGSVTPETLLEDVSMPESLADAVTAEGQRRIEKITEGVHIARGFALGNCILIEAPEGALIVDTTESFAIAGEVLAAFRNITAAPIRAIIYTHHHGDHVYGAKAFIDENGTFPEIWAHEQFQREKEKTVGIGNILYTRSMRQFGPYLPDNQRRGLELRFGGGMESIGLVNPTHLLRGKEANLTIAGLKVRLLHIPGETADHMGVWIPSKRMLLCGDNIYRAFPNLYALRGTVPRDSRVWVRSLDIMRHLRSEYLVPSHTQPVRGEQRIFNLLTQYRDAIQFIHDQTMRYMNKGMYPVDIVQHIQLPEDLAEHPYLQEIYGTVEWSVKAVFSNHLGWFSGNIVDLDPLNTKEKALRMIQLAGGVGSLAAAAQTALNKGDYRWALELSSHIFHLNSNHAQAKDIRLQALKLLAAAQKSGNGRYYYLTTALEDHKLIDIKMPKDFKTALIHAASLKDIFKSLAVRLKAEEVEGQNLVIVFNFTDVDEAYTLTLRNSILDIQSGSTWNRDVKVTLESTTWRRLLSNELNPLSTYLSGDIVIEGGLLIFRRFMSYIERD